MSSTWVVARQVSGLTRQEFPLERPDIREKKNEKQIDYCRRDNTKQRNIRCFPVKKGHFHSGGHVHGSAIRFCSDDPG